MLNLPEFITLNSVKIDTFTYDANGQKLRNQSTANGRWDYINGIIYNDQNTSHTSAIAFIQTEEGRATLPTGSTVFAYTYDLKDYLGNIRASFDNGGTGGTTRVVQEDNYYPFGLDQLVYSFASQNRYLYNGKEMQLDLTSQYDYGARFYDPVVARWTTVDPLAELSRRWSPYNYGEDNSIRNIDPDGMAVDDVLATLHGEDAQNFVKYLQQHNGPGDKKKKKQTTITGADLVFGLRNYKNAPHLMPRTHWWEKVLDYISGGRTYNDVIYDENGNPTGINYTQKMEIDLPFGPGEVSTMVEIIEGFKMGSSTVMEGTTLTRTVSTLQMESKSGSIAKLLGALEADAKAKGATTIVIKGQLVIEDKLFNPDIAARFGYVYKQISNTAFEIVKSLK